MTHIEKAVREISNRFGFMYRSSIDTPTLVFGNPLFEFGLFDVYQRVNPKRRKAGNVHNLIRFFLATLENGLNISRRVKCNSLVLFVNNSGTPFIIF